MSIHLQFLNTSIKIVAYVHDLQGGGAGGYWLRATTQVFVTVTNEKNIEYHNHLSLEFKSRTKVYNVGRVVTLLLILTHEAKSQTCMYILCLFEDVFKSHVSLVKKD
jgi:hypothetical protein